MIDTVITIAVISYLTLGFAYYTRALYLIFSLSKEEYEYGLEQDWYPPLRDIAFNKQLINIVANGLITVLLYPMLVYSSSNGKEK